MFTSGAQGSGSGPRAVDFHVRPSRLTDERTLKMGGKDSLPRGSGLAGRCWSFTAGLCASPALRARRPQCPTGRPCARLTPDLPRGPATSVQRWDCGQAGGLSSQAAHSWAPSHEALLGAGEGFPLLCRQMELPRAGAPAAGILPGRRPCLLVFSFGKHMIHTVFMLFPEDPLPPGGRSVPCGGSFY